LFLLTIEFDFVFTSLTSTFLLFNMGAESESLRGTAGVLSLIRSVDELRLLGVVPAVEKLVASEEGVADSAFEGD
jgi:hypothetical protein